MNITYNKVYTSKGKITFYRPPQLFPGITKYKVCRFFCECNFFLRNNCSGRLEILYQVQKNLCCFCKKNSSLVREKNIIPIVSMNVTSGTCSFTIHMNEINVL